MAAISFVLTPVAVLEFHTRRIAAGIAAPFFLRKAALHLAGAHDDEIAAADLDVLRLGAGVEFVVGNAVAVGQPVHALEARDVEQHAAADHLALGVFDAELAETIGVDFARVVTVVHFLLIENVAERIPMRRRLHRHVDGVVGVADARHHVLPAGDRVGAGRQHGVDRVPASAEQTGLRAGAVERNAKREHLAGAHEPRRVDDIVQADVIERADLVVLAPAAPVFQLFRRFRDRLFPDRDVHIRVSSSTSIRIRGRWSITCSTRA